jgi:hypothetical protein
MNTYTELKNTALTEQEKIKFIEKVYNEKVTETKLIKKGNYYFIKGFEESQLEATLDYYYTQALELELEDQRPNNY